MGPRLFHGAHRLPILARATQIEFSEFALIMGKRMLEEDGKVSVNAA